MLAGLSENARLALLGVGASVLAFFVFGGVQALSGPGGGNAVDPIGAVPRDSFLVAQVNAAELRRSPLYETVLGKEGARRDSPLLDARALGLAKLADACGFDPLSRVDRLAVAVPEEGDRGELGVAAKVDVTREELGRCTEALATSHGGGRPSPPKTVGGFAVMEDTREGGAPPRIGYGHGLLVAGRGAWFDAMLQTAESQRPGIAAAAAHASLRTSLTSKPGWAEPTLLVTALLPRSLRERLKTEMGAEAAGDASAAIMAGVLGVSSAGLALRAGEPGKSAEAAIELVCDTDEGCAAVDKLILRKRLEWSRDLSLRLVGLGPLLDSLETKRDRARLRVTLGAPVDGLAQTVERILRLKGGRRPPDGDRLPPPLPKPDERIPGAAGSGARSSAPSSAPPSSPSSGPPPKP